MEKSNFYNKNKVESREDFFNKNASLTSSANNLFFELIHEGISEGAKILDIGTGNAFVLEQLAKTCPSKYSELWGIDISLEMIEKAKEKTRGLAGIQLILGDNMNLPFQPGFFDAVTAKNVTIFSESEVYRVLKTSGKFFFRGYGIGKGLKEIADIFRERLVRARDSSFYVKGLEAAGFKNIILKELDIKREYSFEELLQVMQMFPFLDHFEEEDKAIIKALFKDKEKIQLTSDQIIIIGEK